MISCFLGGEAEIKEIKTQGLQLGNGSAWVTKFFLDSRRTDNSEWMDYTENSSVKVSRVSTSASFYRQHLVFTSSVAADDFMNVQNQL